MYNLSKANIKMEDRDGGSKYLLFTESASKVNSGGLKHKSVQRKRVEVRQDLSQGERCLVTLYERYISCVVTVKLP